MVLDLRKIKCESNNFEKLSKANYLEYELNAKETIIAAETIEKNLKNYASASILYFRALQVYSNALLIKKLGIKSKGKNCQFYELYQEKILIDNEINKISNLASIRNDIYYLNVIYDEEKEKEYIILCKEVIEIIKSKF